MRLLALTAATLAARSAQAQATSEAPAAIVTVRGPARSASPTALTFGGEQAAQGAGTQGDPAKALESLPGLGRSGPGGEVVAWGSEPRESRIEIDGVEVPRLYHGSAVRSVLTPALVESLTVTPGGFGAEHGRATGGLVQLRTRALPLSEPRWQLSADTLDAAALVGAPITVGKSAALVSARYGYIDRWLPSLLDSGARGLYRIPQYWDGSAAIELSRSLRVVALASSDDASFDVASDDPSRVRGARTGSRFGRAYALYRATDADGTSVEVVPFVGWDGAERRESSAGRASELRVSAPRYGLRARYDTRLSDSARLVLGLDAAGNVAHVERHGSAAVPRREGDPYPFGTSPGSGVARDDYRAHQLGVGATVELDWRFGPLSVTPALRIEPTLQEVSRTRPPIGDLPDIGSTDVRILVEPRATLEARLSREVRLFASGGLYHQPPDVTDLGARFGNPRLGPSRAAHVAFGEAVQWRTRTRVEVTLFNKWLSELAVRAPEATPGLAESLAAVGTGRVMGAQLLVRQAEVHGVSGWLAATLSRSERAAPGSADRLSDFDTPLVVALVVQKVWGAWRFGARGRYATGAPRTPVVGAFYDLTTNELQPELGATNSARLRPFLQLDLRVDRGFRVDERTQLVVYLDMLNVTARRNQEEVVYASDFRTFGSVTGLPSLAVVGVRVER